MLVYLTYEPISETHHTSNIIPINERYNTYYQVTKSFAQRRVKNTITLLLNRSLKPQTAKPREKNFLCKSLLRLDETWQNSPMKNRWHPGYQQLIAASNFPIFYLQFHNWKNDWTVKSLSSQVNT